MIGFGGGLRGEIVSVRGRIWTSVSEEQFESEWE